MRGARISNNNTTNDTNGNHNDNNTNNANNNNTNNNSSGECNLLDDVMLGDVDGQHLRIGTTHDTHMYTHARVYMHLLPSTPFYSALLCSALLYSTLLMHGMAWYGMVWHGMVWYGMVRYHMIRPDPDTTRRCDMARNADID